jgi:hypothetical protein
VFIIYSAAIVSTKDAVAQRYPNTQAMDICFLAVYWIEVLLKLYCMGWRNFWRIGFNRCGCEPLVASASACVFMCVAICG